MSIVLSTAMFYPRTEAEWLEFTSGLDFTGYEIMPQDLSECTPDYFHSLKSRIGDKRILSIHFPLLLMGFFINPYPRAVETGRTLMQNLVEAAAKVGAEDIVVHSNAEGWDLLRESTEANLKYLAELAADHKISIDVENTKRSDCNTPAKLQAKVESLASPSVRPMLDVTEAMESGVDPCEFLCHLPGIHHIHLSDHKDDIPHVPLGSGAIQWERFFAALHATGFRGNLVIELSYHHLLDNPTGVLEQSIAFVKDHLRKAKTASRGEVKP